MTEDKGENDVLKAIRTIPGNFCKDHYNQRQIDVIKDEILPKYSEEEIAYLEIIAPYNNQTDAIRSQIPGIDAATVYANRSWAHVDFTVFNRVTKETLFGIEVDGYNYHKKGAKQAERDQKKNAIFELIGLPLLRLSTKGSGEEQRIKEQLDTYL